LVPDHIRQRVLASFRRYRARPTLAAIRDLREIQAEAVIQVALAEGRLQEHQVDDCMRVLKEHLT
jgi:hypothetical protein